MTEPPPVSPSRKIDWKNQQEWTDVNPYFAHYKGNVMARDPRGRYDQYYVNKSGRNDIVGARVSRDDRYIYFYVERAKELTSSSDRHWMMLFFDDERNKSRGGY